MTNPEPKTMNGKHGATPGDYVRIARPDHWIKNLFILPGTFAAWALLRPSWDAAAVLRLALALASTCLVASSNYVINEWLDAKFDRFHPTKKNRPVVVADLKAAPRLCGVGPARRRGHRALAPRRPPVLRDGRLALPDGDRLQR